MAKAAFDHPHDTPLSSGLRFATELIAWIAGPWAVWSVYGPIAGIAALIVLVALPAVFSTPGDKNTIIVATPGPTRIGIELFLHVIALIAPLMIWPGYTSVFVMVIVLGSLIVGFPRLIWLARGAPLPRQTRIN